MKKYKLRHNKIGSGKMIPILLDSLCSEMDKPYYKHTKLKYIEELIKFNKIKKDLLYDEVQKIKNIYDALFDYWINRILHDKLFVELDELDIYLEESRLIKIINVIQDSFDNFVDKDKLMKFMFEELPTKFYDRINKSDKFVLTDDFIKDYKFGTRLTKYIEIVLVKLNKIIMNLLPTTKDIFENALSKIGAPSKILLDPLVDKPSILLSESPKKLHFSDLVDSPSITSSNIIKQYFI